MLILRIVEGVETDNGLHYRGAPVWVSGEALLPSPSPGVGLDC